LEDVARVCAHRVALVLTENVPDPVALQLRPASYAVERIANRHVKGFGANHNAAFKRCSTPYFCVANPDIRLPTDPFPALLECLREPKVGVVGPVVRSPTGNIEDSARRFPTPAVLFRKIFTDKRIPDYPLDLGPLRVDWVAGMFMLFRREAFDAVRGFDEAYFLYYEDADICDRLRRQGFAAIYEPRAQVVHEAQRGSRRNPRLALRHMASAARFLARR
jgi:N-acetylglucosaminyl-diphospho-decaprenol L-rhamnosyltransferase